MLELVRAIRQTVDAVRRHRAAMSEFEQWIDVSDPARWLFRWPFRYLPARLVLTTKAMVLLNSVQATIGRIQIDARDRVRWD